MDRRTFGKLAASGGVASVFAASGLGGAVASASSGSAVSSGKPGRSVVLVHGAYADGSCWADVIRGLQAAGVAVASVQNPLTSLADDAAAVRRILDLQPGPTILVGHSYAGAVISEVGDHPAVSSLVYLSARAPEAGEDYPALAAKFPTPPANAGIVYVNGFGGLTEEAFLDDFANGVPRDRARVLYAAQGRVAQTLFGTKTTAAAWQHKPSRYVITTEDRTTAPELQRFVAKRMNAEVLEIASGHLSLITHPREVTRFILGAVRA
ncbi:MAG TPA: alpha/beta hydrolase [Amycolatopsis sp.]|jgi:pimeloyl-ACP methyl ester carboxylesterase